MNKLPFEIFNQILTEFVNDLYDEPFRSCGTTATEPYLDKSAYTKLIKLRLVSKIWSKAIIQFYFENIEIDDWRRAELIIDNWKDDLFRPYFPCPVKSLRIRELWHTHVEGCGVPSERNHAGWPDIDQVARLIELLGENLKKLVITLRCCLRLPPEFIKAIKSVINLKSLSISFGYGTSDGIYDLDSLSELFSVILKLERLSLHSDRSGCLKLKPSSLSNLRYLSLAYETNLQGISDITKASRDTLKFIELDAFKHHEGLQQVLEPVNATVEGLFASSNIQQLGKSATSLSFPNLRVIGTHYMWNHITSKIDWLQAPIFKHVRTIITDLDHSEAYWQNAVKLAGVNAWKQVPNFKHLVFTTHDESDRQEIKPALIEAFKSLGIQCHLTDQLTPDKMLVSIFSYLIAQISKE